MLTRPRAGPVLSSLLPILVLGGCGGPATSDRVVVYSALDEEFAQPVLLGFARQTGVRVDAKYDVESSKTVGLTSAILTEAERPVCDVFWNNEILNTLRLNRAGRLAPIHPQNAKAFPASYRARDNTWFGFAARARVLLVNTELVPPDRRPRGLRDLLSPARKGRIGLAKPLFGTTLTHAVCLFQAWGPEKARSYFHELKANEAQVLAGNKMVAQAVGSGRLEVGLTDTDDSLEEIAAGNPVAIIYPDQGPDELGTLFIPNTLAVVRGSPHPENAERLVDYLLRPEVERALAEGPSGQVPLNPTVNAHLQVETPRTVKPMSVDFDAAVDFWNQTVEFLAAEFGADRG